MSKIRRTVCQLWWFWWMCIHFIAHVSAEWLFRKSWVLFLRMRTIKLAGCLIVLGHSKISFFLSKVMRKSFLVLVNRHVHFSFHLRKRLSWFFFFVLINNLFNPILWSLLKLLMTYRLTLTFFHIDCIKMFSHNFLDMMGGYEFFFGRYECGLTLTNILFTILSASMAESSRILWVMFEWLTFSGVTDCRREVKWWGMVDLLSARLRGSYNSSVLWFWLCSINLLIFIFSTLVILFYIKLIS